MKKPLPAPAAVPSASACSRMHAELQQRLRRELYSQLALVTGGLAPDDYAKAWWEWYVHLATHPGRQRALTRSALQKALDNWQFMLQSAAGTPLPPQHADFGFTSPAWSRWPFNLYAHAYGNWASWMREALRAAPGLSPRSAQTLSFVSRQLIDAASPANFLHTNPELLEKTRAESGRNLVRGFKHWLDDVQRMLTARARAAGTERFKVGEQVAVTPGKVVLRNRLIELIQYSPRTESVHAEPILITPAWIMKYYILDLSPHNSLVRYLVEQGHTVFVVSWKNPTAAERHLGLDDYVQLGFREALDAVNAIVPGRKVHAVGYCIGGTLLSIGAAALAGAGDARLATVTLFATVTDFSEPGELSVFITPSQLAMLEAMMHKSGVLTSEQMAGAFAMLRAKDLLWAPSLQSYVHGERPKINDLMAWNADGTRMPWRMHSEYLDRLYLKNELARGTFTIGGERIDLQALRMPMFVVGTETDHVAPWRAVYKVRGLTRSPDYTFLLTSGGHNAGIVSGPVNPKRRHRLLTWSDPHASLTPDEWLERAPCHQGSWWPAWQRWLAERSDPQRVAPPALGNARAGYPPLEDAPGLYVHG